MPINSEVYQGLRFSFACMEREIDNMRLLAKPFITPESFEQALPGWRRDLVNFKNGKSAGSHRWEIPERNPIKTVISKGEYEAHDRAGELSVYGTLCGIWEIKAEQQRNTKFKPAEFFILEGIASTKIQIWDCAKHNAPVEIARWTLETGDQHSPGCHFHTQIDLDPADNKFPKALSVPRLPAYLHTPMDALDYLLGELFQKRWYRRMSEGKDAVNLWNGCQKTRLVRMLTWHKECFQEAGGSPWSAFKRRKPAINLLFDR
jgi:hypothetical protein